MHIDSRWRRAATLAVLAICSPSLAVARGGPKIPGARDLGRTSDSKQVTVSLWLKMHQASSLEQNALAVHDPSSARYQQWSAAAFSPANLPTAAEAQTVSDFLRSQGLTVLGIGPRNLYVQATGTAAQVQAALKAELHEFQLASKTFQANVSGPTLPANVNALVSHVGGLTDFRPQPMNMRPGGPEGTFSPALLSANPNGIVFSAGCFRPPQTVKFSSSDASAVYFGNRYGQDITNTAAGTIPPCGYSAGDIQTAYSLDKLYRRGLDGSGQTVAIVDAFGSKTIAFDLAVFSQAMGLPPADLTIIGTPTETVFSGTPNSVWALETTLDVEWVHAIAPGAKILLVVTPDNSFANLFGGIIQAASTPGVTAISNSWGSYEIATDPEFRQAVDGLFQAISSAGISVNFSSGDGGDGVLDIGIANGSWPSGSPFATSVGGVSVGLKKNGKIDFQTAWGNNFTQIADTAANGNAPIDPVGNQGFNGGGGGGVSDVYFKPFYQQQLPGYRRMQPDISWVADPYTGVEIIFTGDPEGGLYIDVIGGTSASCPMFSALWAIATQRAGHLLGNAAARLYRLDDDAITDVQLVGSNANVSGLIKDAAGNSPEIPSDLASPLQNLPDFYSALYNSPLSTRWFVITFGTDSTLRVHDGYDVATGLGTPNPPAFVDSVSHH
ncbi:MAG TPA: S53 family peptidase [Myxococcaceae bacterium]|nr:S53 family peptidase [Myxococcaceae bacterium]